MCFPETSVTNYQSTLRNIPEERRFKWHIYEIWCYSQSDNISYHYTWGPKYTLTCYIRTIKSYTWGAFAQF